MSDVGTLTLVKTMDRQPEAPARGSQAATPSPTPVRRKTPAALEQWERGYELYLAAYQAEFTGPAHQALKEELWRYSLPVMLSMLRTGAIVEHRARHDRHVEISDAAREMLHVSQEERDALAVDTIAATLPFFVSKVLKDHGWDPRGASIQTYFVGALAFCFPRVYEAWYRQWRTSTDSTGSMLDLEGVLEGLGRRRHDLDPAELVALRDTLIRILNRTDQQTLAICAGIAADKMYAEIGAELHLSTPAVEGRMYRLRQDARRMARRDPGTDLHPTADSGCTMKNWIYGSLIAALGSIAKAAKAPWWALLTRSWVPRVRHLDRRLPTGLPRPPRVVAGPPRTQNRTRQPHHHHVKARRGAEHDRSKQATQLHRTGEHEAPTTPIQHKQQVKQAAPTVIIDYNEVDLRTVHEPRGAP